jgi:hypothetical protein
MSGGVWREGPKEEDREARKKPVLDGILLAPHSPVAVKANLPPRWYQKMINPGMDRMQRFLLHNGFFSLFWVTTVVWTTFVRKTVWDDRLASNFHVNLIQCDHNLARVTVSTKSFRSLFMLMFCVASMLILDLTLTNYHWALDTILLIYNLAATSTITWAVYSLWRGSTWQLSYSPHLAACLVHTHRPNPNWNEAVLYQTVVNLAGLPLAALTHDIIAAGSVRVASYMLANPEESFQEGPVDCLAQ